MPFPVIAKRGYKGPVVERLQRQLNKLTSAGLEPDGWFGENTERAVTTFQHDNGFLPDGVVGPFTNAGIMLVPFARRLPSIPPHVRQHDLKRCWAACTESWLAAQPSRTNYTMEQIVKGMQEEGVANADGSLPVSSERAWELYFGLRPIRETAATFYAERTLQRLTGWPSPLMIGVADKVGHIVVCFGVAVTGTTPHLIKVDPFQATHPANLDVSILHKTGSRRVMTWIAGNMPLLR